MLEQMDTDGDGMVSREEFVTFHSSMTHRMAAELKTTLLEKGLPKPPEQMAADASAAAAAAWEVKINNLHKRFSSRGRAEMEAALKLMGGHAGNAVGLLSKLPETREMSDA